MDAPEPSDPYEVADAQMNANVGTSAGSAIINNYNETSPLGSTRYRPIGFGRIQTPDGRWIRVPRYERITRLSPTQQQLYNQQTAAASGMNNLALQQIQNLSNIFSQPLSFSGAPRVTIPQLNTGYDTHAYQSTFDAGGDIDQELGGTSGNITYGVGPLAGEIQHNFGNTAGNIQYGVGPTSMGVQYTVDPTTGQVQYGYGDTEQGIQYGYRPTSGGIQYGFGETPDLRYGFDPTARDIQYDYGPTDFSEDRLRVENALMSRFENHFGDREAAMDAKLASQGLMPGGEAWNDQYKALGEDYNDATFQSILAGGQEQSRLADLARTAAMFSNAAQAQEFGQNAYESEFFNQTADQYFRQLMARAGFSNEAQAQEFGQIADEARFGNTAQLQDYNQLAERARFANSAQLQEFNQNFARANFTNEAQQQEFNQLVTQANIQNAAQAQEFAQNLARSGFINDAQAQEFAQAYQQAELQNSAQAQEFDQNFDTFRAENAAQQQQFAQNAMMAEFFNNIQRLMTGESRDQAVFENQAMLQDYGMQEDAYDRYVRELLAMRSGPINEITSLLHGGQVTYPQFQNPYQQPMANTPIGDYFMNADRLETAQYNTMMQGLFGLGGDLMSGIFGLMG